MGTKLDPQTKKITLIEFDYGIGSQTVWFNWTAGVWYVDFDGVYELIDPIYLEGITSSPSITRISAVREDGVALSMQVSLALCISTDSSAFWDQSDRRLYIHLAGGAEPSLHTEGLSVTTGISNQAISFNAVDYDARLRSAPSISKSKDPLFFGRVTFDGGTIGIDNTDGAYDQIPVTNIFGSEIRVLQGFDTDAYASFVRMATGALESVEITEDLMNLSMVDKRKSLSRNLPLNTFSLTAYPNMDAGNDGKPIPLTYGALHGVPALCVNDNESPMPAQYTFVLSDTTSYPIQSLDALYVAGTLQGQNLVTNPGAESGTASWALAEGAGTLSATAAVKMEGSQSFLMIGTAGFCNLQAAVIPGNTYIVTVRARGASATANGLYINLYERSSSAAGGYVTAALASSTTSIATNVAVATTWTLYQAAYTVPANMLYVSVGVKNGGGGPAGGIYFDDFHLVAGFSGVSLASGTFTLPAAVYTPRDEVAVDMHGYITSTPYIKDNAADVIRDLMEAYLGISYVSANFNTGEWATATAQAKQVGVYVGELTPIYDVIENICASTLANLIQKDDGTFTLRVYDPARSVAQTFALDELMQVPSYKYDPTQVLSSASVGYFKHWASGRYSRVHDTSHESTVFTAYALYREREFLTLLENAADAQAFSSAVMNISATAMQTVKLAFRLQPLGLEIMDFITAPIWRPTKPMLGTATMEVIEISKDLLGSNITLTGRVVNLI